MTIILGPQWTRQPQYATGVNRGNPITQGIAFLVSPGAASGRPIDLVSGRIADVAAGSIGGGAAGRATVKGSANTASFRWTDFGARLLTSDNSGTADFSFIVLAAQSSTAVGIPVSVCDPTGTYPIFQMVLNGTGDAVSSSGTFDTFTFNNSFSKTTAISGAVTANSPQVYGYSRTSALQKGYARGVMGASSAFSSIACIRAASDLVIQGRADSAKAGGDLVWLTAAWNRALSDAEHASLAFNPWQLFAPLQIIIPTATAAATAPTISALSAINVTATSAQPSMTYTF